MNEEQTRQIVMQALRAALLGSDGKGWATPKAYPAVVKDTNDGVLDRLARLEKKTGVQFPAKGG
ncbi:MAG: hypothetical protein J2P16_14295 [Mycobacterium sp.]|nr:hypothetical protein [Mycobacterium sp.]